MKTFLCSLPFVSVLPSLASAGNNQLPAEVTEAFRAPKEAILYLLEPWEEPAAGDDKLYRFKVLGHTNLDREHTATAC